MAITPTPIGIAVVEHSGRYLVGFRSDDGPLPGLAEFPGGKCLPNESPRDCAVRECLEETRLKVTPVELLHQQRFAYPHDSVELHFWLCRVETGETVADDQCGFRWYLPELFSTLTFPPVNRLMIERLAVDTNVQ